jgi:hypothetical protein
MKIIEIGLFDALPSFPRGQQGKQFFRISCEDLAPVGFLPGGAATAMNTALSTLRLLSIT